MTVRDAPFILELLNEPGFLRFIGDKCVRTIDDARRYIETGPVASYVEHGFGLFLVELRAGATPIGMCGLLRRASMQDIEVGFAFLARYCSRGYATESGLAVMRLARETFGLKRIAAITDPDNHGSANVLNKIGLEFHGMIRLPEFDSQRHLFIANSAA
jgi:RimJ/RimL family protein N-acetyltransferase